MLLYQTIYVTIVNTSQKNATLSRNYRKGEKMNKVIKEAKPIIEATLITVVLVGTALAVPAAIIFTAI